ncbi:MAG: hypothetical protein ABIU95_11010 [Burkholderiales bacterium]
MRCILSAGLALGLGGCSTLLPRSVSTTETGWASFAEARNAIEHLIPYQARRDELVAAGIDPFTNSAVTILSFADIAQRARMPCGRQEMRRLLDQYPEHSSRSDRQLLARLVQLQTRDRVDRLDVHRADPARR